MEAAQTTTKTERAKMSNKIKGLIIVRERTSDAPKIHKINEFFMFLLKVSFVFFVVSVVVLVLGWTFIAHRLSTYSYLQMQNDSLIQHSRQVDTLKANIVRINQYLEYFKLVSSLDEQNSPPSLDEYLRTAEVLASFDMPDAQREFRRIPKIRPVTGVISRGFEVGHPAIDFAAPLGRPIRAAADGVVLEVYFAEDLGNVVLLQHADGYQTLYAHCQEILVKVGQAVVQGETIALVGNTGSRSRGPHLHYEVIKNNRHINPETLFL